MARYIDADKIPAKLFSVAATDNFYGMGVSQGIDIALKIINETPTADVVEVVRCKDCKYYENQDSYRCDHPEMYGEDCYGFWMETNPDDFCSYGEKRQKNDFKESDT